MSGGPCLTPPSLMQFGIGRFLLAHVDLFIEQANRLSDTPVGIVAIQSSQRPDGGKKAYCLIHEQSYPVQLRGLRDGQRIDERHEVKSLRSVLVAHQAWAEIERRFRDDITHVVSNTSERGYEVPKDDSPLLDCPVSFPAKLTRLLKLRFDAGRSGVTLLPCELLSDNGLQLKRIVLSLAQRYFADATFATWLQEQCVWAVTLVDRIVSTALEPIGAVAEPYGLWAIQETPGLQLPFTHPDVQLVADIRPYERRKLHLLNLAHTWLVARWQQLGLEHDVSLVRHAMDEPHLGGVVETMLREEVVPVLDREMPGMQLHAYVTSILERFRNPWLDHHLSDIAQNHAEKCQRRIAPVIDMARSQGRTLPLLEQAMMT
ncbi:mannitol dehydrogenase [Halomonas binhaiensis]|uniref:Mannitol dehydrogenase n=1 Tax=Halomonas binhaiensis TaxID=2562282 RepID=A0A5C1NFQ6_9GAMM|nr:mannitol dehydrogenase [Halomonas binhaiensis]QEM82054.1 mannitol dehydrogenase [Halomonas binhaiensis]